jgi:phosphoribosylanthranilate isomerase
MRVKICGITTPADAIAAIDAGADALGFNFYRPSPRYIAPETLAPWLRDLPPFIQTVAVLVDPLKEEIESIERLTPFDLWQLHGHESSSFCAILAPRRLIKAIRISSTNDLALAQDFPVCSLLIDAPTPLLGGSGKTCDWLLARQFCMHSRLPVILSGGLTPENITQAILTVQPYAIDVCSGVESAPGKKDHYKMRDFIAAVKEATQAPLPTDSN